MSLLLVVGGACGPPAAVPAPETVRMLAGGPIGEEFLAEYRKSLPAFRITMEHTRGSEFVVTALQHSVADAGFAQADAVYAAYRTSLSGDAQPLTQLRGIAIGESANVYIAVRRDSPYRSVADLKHTRIGVFPNTTHAVVYARLIFGAYGLDPGTAEFKELTPPEMAARLADGSIEAATLGGPGIPDSAVRAARSVGLRILDLRGEVIAKLRGRYPFFNPVVVTADELPGQVGTVQTLGVDSLLVCRQDLPEQEVYQLTRAFFEASARVAEKTADAPPVDPDLAAATPVPLHPGAARYYREREVLQ